MAVGVIDLAFLLIAQDAVSFRALTETMLGFFLVFGVPIGMPFQGRLPVCRLDLLDRGGPANPENFVIIVLMCLRHIYLRLYPLLPDVSKEIGRRFCGHKKCYGSVHCAVGCASGMNRYAHHRGTQHASVID